jgi:hypothetical protein
MSTVSTGGAKLSDRRTPEELAHRVELREQVIELGARRAELEAAQETLRADLSRVLAEARSAGWSVTKLSGWSGLGRQRIYELTDIVNVLD